MCSVVASVRSGQDTTARAGCRDSGTKGDSQKQPKQILARYRQEVDTTTLRSVLRRMWSRREVFLGRHGSGQNRREYARGCSKRANFSAALRPYYSHAYPNPCNKFHLFLSYFLLSCSNSAAATHLYLPVWILLVQRPCGGSSSELEA